MAGENSKYQGAKARGVDDTGQFPAVDPELETAQFDTVFVDGELDSDNLDAALQSEFDDAAEYIRGELKSITIDIPTENNLPI